MKSSCFSLSPDLDDNDDVLGNDDDDVPGNDDDDDVDDDHREERTLKATWPGLFPDPLDPVRRAWPLSQRGKHYTAQMYTDTITIQRHCTGLSLTTLRSCTTHDNNTELHNRKSHTLTSLSYKQCRSYHRKKYTGLSLKGEN